MPNSSSPRERARAILEPLGKLDTVLAGVEKHIRITTGEGLDESLRETGLSAHRRIQAVPLFAVLATALEGIEPNDEEVPKVFTCRPMSGRLSLFVMFRHEEIAIPGGRDHPDRVLARFLFEMDQARAAGGDAPGLYRVHIEGVSDHDLKIHATSPRQAALLAAAVAGHLERTSQADAFGKIRAVTRAIDGGAIGAAPPPYRG